MSVKFPGKMRYATLEWRLISIKYCILLPVQIHIREFGGRDKLLGPFERGSSVLQDVARGGHEWRRSNTCTVHQSTTQVQ